jgi:hypothetical protein
MLHQNFYTNGEGITSTAATRVGNESGLAGSNPLNTLLLSSPRFGEQKLSIVFGLDCSHYVITQIPRELALPASSRKPYGLDSVAQRSDHARALPELSKKLSIVFRSEISWLGG